MTTVEAPGIQCIRWHEGRVDLLDQTRLPQDEVWLKLNDHRDVIDAIRQMRIRGAPAIGVAGAYALALAAAEFSQTPGHPLMSKLETAAVEIKAARPTGANLAWAVDRMLSAAGLIKSGESMAEALAAEAIRIQQEDADANRRIGRLGADLLDHGSRVLTHCNAGALATGGYGTALGVIRTAWADRRIVAVFATETRPLLQGARLTAWELVRSGIDTTLLPDSAAGQLIRGGQVQAVIVGADRIAANGDVANKIGTYSLAVIARENRVPFYVAAPTSTIDLTMPSGDSIPIEERSPDEVTHIGGARVAAEAVKVMNPAFDVVPNKYVAAIVTESGVVRQPYAEGLAAAVEASVGRG